MKNILLTLVAGLAVWSLSAAELNWTTDLAKAQAKAKAENKLVLLDFTGSDWCPWCIKFEKEVLSTDEFAKYAQANLELVMVDFPRSKAQTDALKQANKSLKDKYKIEGFPTYVVLNTEGKEVGRQVGYKKGGPQAFIKELDGFKAK
jgi:protein disulfide-isomerase